MSLFHPAQANPPHSLDTSDTLNSLPGADRLARRTGATIIANGEAITVMRAAGVPEAQLQPVAGGERIPLFTRAARDEATAKASSSPPRPGPRLPPAPPPSSAVADVHVWPALHCLLPPGDHASLPEVIDTGHRYVGSGDDPHAERYACTIDITRNMTHGFGALIASAPGDLPPGLPEEFHDFLPYMRDRERNRYSFYDGGQLMFNFLMGGASGDDGPTLLWHGHLGCYEGIMRTVEPKPDVAILAIAGRGNLNGRPFDGSAAEFAVKEVQWLGEPRKVIWCLHDEAPIIPKRIDTRAATDMVHEETRSKVVELEHVKPYNIFE